MPRDKKNHYLWQKAYREKNKERIAKYQKEYQKTPKYKKYKSENRKKYYTYTPKNKLRPGEEYHGTNGTGRKYEKIALSLLKNGKDCNVSGHCKYDILWNGKRIEVKMRNLNKESYWHFTKKNNECDYYLLFCCISETIQRVYFIPASITKSCINIRVDKDKYKNYIIGFRGVNVD